MSHAEVLSQMAPAGSHTSSHSSSSSQSSSVSAPIVASGIVSDPHTHQLPTKSPLISNPPPLQREKVKGIFPACFQAEFGITVKSSELFYQTQDYKNVFGFYTEPLIGNKYPKVIHINQPYQGWMREIVIDNDGNPSVQYLLTPLNSTKTTTSKLSSGEIKTSDSVNPHECQSEHSLNQIIIRTAAELDQYISQIQPSGDVSATLQATSFDFDDVFCLCHRPEDGDYFNCDYGLAGCSSWFHSGI